MSIRSRVVGIVAVTVLLVLFMGYWVAGSIISSKVDSRLNAIHGSNQRVSEKARRLHTTLLIGDLHADSLLWDRDLLARNDRGHVDVPRLIEGNVAIQAFTIVTKVPHKLNVERNTSDSDDITRLAIAGRWPPWTWVSLKERALYQADKLKTAALLSGGKLSVITNKRELDDYLTRRKHNQQITAGFLGVEGAHCLEGNLDNIDVFYDRGIRMIAPTHFFDNDIGGSAHGVNKAGLTDKGKEMIRRMQAKFMIVDLAHASSAVIKDVLAISTKPVVVSHTGVRGTCNNHRNLTDAELMGIAKTGGVIGIGYWRQAVCGDNAKAIARAIRYTANLVGVEHVALGSDFDGATSAPFDVSHLDLVTQALLDQGFSDADIRLIMGENAIRVLRESLPD
jgi:membrane dipeptidase